MLQIEKDAGLKILLIDDEEIIFRALGKNVLERMGYEVSYASRAEQGLEIFAGEKIDIVISDIKMPGMDGIELVRRLKERSRDIEVVLITAYGDMEIAIEALKAGAFDLISKPIELQEMIACLQRTRRYQEMRREKERVQQQLELLTRAGEEGLERAEIIGESRAIGQVHELISRVAPVDQTTVLIQGESGTGKELVARAVHRQSPRAERPFISINCTAIPENLLESELFGHEKGAFTDAREKKSGLFELGRGGTLFLDEIGDMTLSAQSKILRVLEERQVRRVGGEREIAVDVRLIAATNQDLEALVEAGKFRQDLYFRINVFNIELPPLRDRGDDVLLLAYHFIREFSRDFRKKVVGAALEVETLLKGYAFPGNVRELRNMIERAVILCDGKRLEEEDFQGRISGPVAVEEEEEETLDLAEVEKRTIRAALKKAEGKKVEAARYLGINDDALRRRMKKHGLS